MLDLLLEVALRATLIAAAALGTLWLLRVRAAAVRHRVFTVVLVAMLVLPLSSAWAPELPLRVLPPAYTNTPSTVETPPPDFVGVTIAAVEPSTRPTVEPQRSATLELAPAPSWN
jgi:hypothetical protein